MSLVLPLYNVQTTEITCCEASLTPTNDWICLSASWFSSLNLMNNFCSWPVDSSMAFFVSETESTNIVSPAHSTAVLSRKMHDFEFFNVSIALTRFSLISGVTRFDSSVATLLYLSTQAKNLCEINRK